MKKNGSDYFIALTVVLCSVVLLGALTFALSGLQWHEPKRTLVIDFANVGGIQAHSELRYAGAPAGRVKAMRALTPEERQHLPTGHETAAVRVTVVVNDDVPPLGNDASVTLSSDTLLSEEYVAIIPGRANAAPLDEKTALMGKPAAGLANVAESIGPLLANANEAIVELKTQLAAVVPKLGTVLDSTKATADSASSFVTSADQILKANADTIRTVLDQLGKAIADLRGVLVSTSQAVDNSGKLIDHGNQLVGHVDEQLAGRMRELSVVLQNLKVVTTYAKSLTETLAARPNALIFGGKTKVPLPTEAEIIRSNKPVPLPAAALEKRR